jgi:hypothetical protein
VAAWGKSKHPGALNDIIHLEALRLDTQMGPHTKLKLLPWAIADELAFGLYISFMLTKKDD